MVAGAGCLPWRVTGGDFAPSPQPMIRHRLARKVVAYRGMDPRVGGPPNLLSNLCSVGTNARAGSPVLSESTKAMAEPDLTSAAFPTLDDAQIADIVGCAAAKRRAYRDGETLVGIGETDFGFFIVLSG